MLYIRRWVPYNWSETGYICSFNCIRDAIAMLKEQEVRYTPEEAWRVLVSHGQQDKRFGWGEVIKYSPSEVQEILEEAINESVAE